MKRVLRKLSKDKSLQKNTQEEKCPFICDSNQWPYRYMILTMVCVIHLTTLYCMQIPGGLMLIITQVMEVDITQYDLLFSVTAWPNIILCLIGGVLIDRVVGVRLGYVIVTSIAAIGQLIWALGAFTKLYWLMLVGRFLLGAGNQLTFITANAIKGIWFKDKEISFATSLDICASAIGGALGLLLPGYIYQSLQFIVVPKDRLGATLLIGFGIISISVFCSIVYAVLDKKGENGVVQQQKRFSCEEDFKDFTPSFWLITIINMLMFTVAWTFLGVAQVFFINKFGLTMNEASIANSLIFGSTCLIIPAIGLLIDIIGYNIFWSQGCIILAIISHLVIMLSANQTFIPYLSAVIYSFSYTIFGSAIWPIPAYIIKEHQLTTAFGFMQCPFNLGLSILPIVIGVVIDRAGYFAAEVLNILLLYGALLLTIIVWIFDFNAVKCRINVPRWTELNKITKKVAQGEEMNGSVPQWTDFNKINKKVSQVEERKSKQKDKGKEIELFSFQEYWNGKKWVRY